MNKKSLAIPLMNRLSYPQKFTLISKGLFRDNGNSDTRLPYLLRSSNGNREFCWLSQAERAWGVPADSTVARRGARLRTGENYPQFAAVRIFEQFGHKYAVEVYNRAAQKSSSANGSTKLSTHSLGG